MATKPTQTLTDAEKKQLAKNILTIRMIAGGIGTFGGAAYAFKKQKGFWGYVGFILLGSIITGAIATVATAPMAAKLEVDEITK